MQVSSEGELGQEFGKRGQHVQRQSLPVLLSGKDCVSCSGSGKAYLLLIYSVIKIQRSAVQALIVVPTGELGMQVTKVARMLAAKSVESDNMQRTCTIMSLLDGGMLKRHKSWMKICRKKERLSALLYLLQKDAPRSGINFVSEQSEKSKKAGRPPSATLLFDFLKASYDGDLEIILFEEDMNFNARAASLSDKRQRGFILVATDLASRGFDLPQTTHIYNFDLPRTAVDYLHRSGMTARLPFSADQCFVTSLTTSEEQFVLQRYQNELLFQCEELILEPFAP